VTNTTALHVLSVDGVELCGLPTCRIANSLPAIVCGIRAQVGEFSVNGTLSGSKVTFEKKYLNAHTLYYKGEMGPDDGYAGMYSFKNNPFTAYDRFVMKFVPS
jgi:hypothetical protein